MMLPTIHLNGTSREALESEAMASYDALRAAGDALCAMMVNGRDFYPQGPDAFTAARAEHVSRIDKLRAVLAEIEQLILHLQEQRR